MTKPEFMTTLLRRSPLFLFPVLIGALHGQSITVTPAEPYVGVGFTQQFSAAVTGLSPATVTWSLTGMSPLNNPKLGTISSTGLYTAPVTPPAQNPVTVQATGSDGKTVGIAYVLVEALGPTLTSVTPSPVNVGTYTVTINGQGFVSGARALAGTGASAVALSTTYVSPTQLTATGYQGSAGTVPFKVSNPGTLYSNTVNVTFVTPIRISPATANVALGASKTFSVSGQTVTQAVTWTATAGTITSTGVYTAPTTMPSSPAVTITATGSAGQTGTAAVTLTQPLTQVAPPAFSPPAGTYTAAQSVALNSTTSGASIRYTTNGTTPSETAGTLYSSAFSVGTTETVKAVAFKTGMSNSAVVSAAYIINLPAVSISVSPTTASLSATQVQGITATVTNSTNLGVTWTLTGAGMLSATSSTSGAPITYTAPATIATQTTVTVTATSSADGTKTATSIITLNPPVVSGGPITVSPSTVSVALNGTQTFTASGQTSVTWSASAGSITTAGVFTAPSAMTPSATVTITALGTNNQVGTATVTLTAGTTLVPTATAQRFLQQAAFGPTNADIANVQALGLQAWLSQQFAMPKVSNYSNMTSGMSARFVTNSVMNADQLRQRVAFALSQITVVSLNSLIFENNVTPFEDLLLSDAFTNYRQILGDVTLSPSMGAFLNMVNNAAANPALGTVANENYAREVMQLFSIGTVMLNQDGSVQFGSDQLPVATYNQTNVTELARVLTGWTFAQSGLAPYWGAGINDGNTDVTSPMVAMPQYHDNGSKTLLPDYQHSNGSAPYVAPAGLPQASDLSAALDNIFYHPNVGPFIGKQLIQHLVKSNPSPAYISHVAAAFANNGSGVRGDMKAVITAVLMDPEARANDAGGNDQPTDGHMQEPALYLAGLIRAFNGTVNDQNYFPYDLLNLDQDIFNAASVFSYYAPNYVVPAGYILPLPATQPTGGEFQIFDTYTSIYRANLVANLFGSFSSPLISYGPGTAIDLTSYQALYRNPTALVNAMDQTLTRGTLPASVKSIITAAVAAEDPAGYTAGMKQVEAALYLIATSNYYNVWH
jgi:uncharacterized protein (DUF1800 family)